MARRKGTSRVTQPGTGSPNGPGAAGPPPGLPSIRERRPALFWGLIVGMLAMLLPLVAGMIQVLL
ncbi:MAG: hypothetical protein AAGA93_00475 [Actinomycetota bacterium]